MKNLTKKQKNTFILSGVLVLVLILVGVALGHQPKPKEVDYTSYVKGLKNWTISIDEKEVDWLEDVTWNKTYIKDVTVDSKKVDLSKEGTYDLVYLIDVVKKDVDDIEVKKTVKVVDKEKAKEEKEETKETSKDEKKSDAKEEKQETKKKATSRNTSDENKTSNKKAPAQNKNTETSKSSSTNINTSKPKCRTETITIPEKGHNERYLISDEVWEDRPVYELKEFAVGNQSGLDITGNPNVYLLDNPNGDTGWHSEYRNVQVGTQPVKIKDAVYGERYVVDQPARTETKKVCE